MKKESVVYWSIIAKPELMTRQNLLIEPPTPLRKDILSRVNKDRTTAGCESCKSMHEVFKNTYILKQPFSVTWTPETNNDFIYERIDSAFKDSLLVDTDLQWVFFSEDSIQLEMTPAYLHNTESSKYGYVAAGSLDISQWFRTINLTYQLWDGVKELKLKANDAAAYINFRTDSKVVLKQFEMNNDLNNIIHGCESLKQVVSNLPLVDLYERFTRSGRHKLVLKHIKNNLID